MPVITNLPSNSTPQISDANFKQTSWTGSDTFVKTIRLSTSGDNRIGAYSDLQILSVDSSANTINVLFGTHVNYTGTTTSTAYPVNFKVTIEYE